MKIAIIGGGGKISSSVVYELLNEIKNVPIEFSLYGRNDEKIADTLSISKRFAGENASVVRETNLDCALTGAEIVFYCATAKTDAYGKYASYGVQNGGFLMSIAEKMTEKCPDAWLTVVTNPPDIPLSAIKMRFGMTKLIGLCNAPIFNEHMTASFLGCDESELCMREVGVNHEYWFYDISVKGKSVYDELRERLPHEYTKELVREGAPGNLKQFHADFPEWSVGFANNCKLLELSGYMSGPVGGSNRYKGLPIILKNMWAVSSRPTANDFKLLTSPELTNEEILKRCGRCAAGIPRYVADVLKSIILDDGKERHVLVLNDGAWKKYPDDVMLQMSCGITESGLVRPALADVPEAIEGVLASRIYQNHLMAKALAYGEEKYLRQALLCYPERVECVELDDFLSKHTSVEPFAQLN